MQIFLGFSPEKAQSCKHQSPMRWFVKIERRSLIILFFSLVSIMMRMMIMVEEAERHLAQGRRGLKLCI